MLIKGWYTAITLIELLVVIAMIGILAAVVAPNIDGWNCRQEVRNDFEKLNGFMQTLRLEAINRNRSMMAHIARKGVNPIVSAYQAPQGRKLGCGSGEWKGANDIFPYKGEGSSLSSNSDRFCFHADGTVTMNTNASDTSYTISRQCGDRKYQYKNQIFGATGFFYKEKNFNTNANTWEEL